MKSFYLAVKISVLLTVVIGLSACGPKRISPAEEADASVATMQWLDKRFGFVNDPQLIVMLNRVTKRLAAAVSGAALDRAEAEKLQGYPWQVFVLDTDQPNALSAGAGVIFLTKGLIKRLNSEGELAAIISHEMSHHILGHVNRAIAETQMSSSPRFVFTIEDETAADTLGLKILTAARYDGRSALSAITNNYRGKDSAAQEWLEPRLANLEAQLKTAAPFGYVDQTSREFNQVKSAL